MYPRGERDESVVEACGRERPWKRRAGVCSEVQLGEPALKSRVMRTCLTSYHLCAQSDVVRSLSWVMSGALAVVMAGGLAYAKALYPELCAIADMLDHSDPVSGSKPESVLGGSNEKCRVGQRD